VTKREFLEELRKRLSDLNDADFAASVAYYEEMIDDRMEDGLSEEEAVKEVGSPAEAASQILEEIPLGKIIKARVSSKKKLPLWVIILLIVGSPIWLSLLVSAVSVVVSLYASLWVVVGSLWGVFASLAVSGTACVMAFPVMAMQDYFYSGLASFGAGLLVLGLAIFAFFGCYYATKGTVFLTKKLVLLIKCAFVRKEAVA